MTARARENERQAVESGGSAETALREGNYPWYDPGTDGVRPIWASKRPWLKWLGRRWDEFVKALERALKGFQFGGSSGVGVSGDLIMTAVFLAALIGFLVVLAVLWTRRDSSAADRSADGSAVGRAARLTDLPEGVRPGSGDPWAEALRRRAAGDLGGAIVCLFAYQLLSLDQMGLIRLAPGRTGRQYVQTIHDPRFADSLEATLGLFEDVYYGRKLPTLEAFEAVWRSAQVFQERRGVAGASR